MTNEASRPTKEEALGFLTPLLDKYRARTIESIEIILNDDKLAYLHDDMRSTLDFMKNATYHDLILGLASQRLTSLKSEWDMEDELLKGNAL